MQLEPEEPAHSRFAFGRRSIEDFIGMLPFDVAYFQCC